MPRVIGIDLGTTNCAVACINTRGDAEILHNTNGDNTTPSVVQFDGDDIIVGKEAKDSAVALPNETVSFAKRYMDNPKSIGFTYGGKKYSAIDISAIILKKLKVDAQKKLNEEIDQAVITVPAYFDNVAKEATKQAAQIAGLEVLQLIMEPSAAAIYYSYMNDHKLEGKRILIYDLGGGTFDVSIADLNNGDIDIIATGGNAKLGGKDFDERIIEAVKDKISQEIDDIDWDDTETKTELYEKAEDIKKTLSSKESVRLKFSFAKKYKGEFTRDELKDCIETLIYNSINVMNMTIQDAKDKDGKNIDEVILVGGSTKMPLIVEAIENELNIKPLQNVNPDEVVAQGAALLATKKSIEKNSNSTEATILSQNIQNSISMIQVADIVPHSVGTILYDEKTGGKRNQIVIKHGEKIPFTSEKFNYQFVYADQKSSIFELTQGESEDADLVELIGNTTLYKPASIPDTQNCTFQTTYSYDENGLIRAYGQIDNGDKFELEVQSKHKLSNGQINKKKKELQISKIE